MIYLLDGEKSEVFNADLKSSVRTKTADDGDCIRLLLPRNNLIDRLEKSLKTPKESAVCFSSHALVSP